MRIAQVAPLHESVPPKLYGGTERVVSYLTEELVRAGHEVTLFASADSVTRATLRPGCERALRLDGRCVDPIPHHVVMVERVWQSAADFDVIHFHCDALHLPLSRRAPTANVTTLHGRLDLPDLDPLFREFADVPMVSISDAQRRPQPHARWVGTVHHGLPPDLYPLRDAPGEYLAFLGRTSPEKGLDRAIEIARRAGMKLRIAAKVDHADRAYFEAVIRPLLAQPHVEFIGEIGEAGKAAFLGRAAALLFPIDWPEPFGLVLIEAMACGTPVVAFPGGAVPEIVTDGATGFVCRDVDGAVECVRRVAGLSRKRCREAFDARFSVARMAADYVRIYERLAEEWAHGAAGRGGHPGRGSVLHPRDLAAGR